LPVEPDRLRAWKRGSHINPLSGIKEYYVHKGKRWVIVDDLECKNKFKLGEFTINKKPRYSPPFKKRK